MTDFSLENTGENNYQLGGVLDFHTVPSALEDSRKLFKPGATIDIDLSRVSKANSAAMALLIEWKSIARDVGSTVRFLQIPSQIKRLAEVCRVEELL